MDERPTGALRRTVLRLLPSPVDLLPDEQLWVQDAPPLSAVMDDLPEPRIADLDALLRDVDALRSTLRRDLSLAATAAEAGEHELAAWLLTQDHDLRTFEVAAAHHLEALEAAEEVEPAAIARRRHRFLSATPFAAAAAVVFAFVAGVIGPSAPSQIASPHADSAALASYDAFTQLALEGGSVSEITAAAKRFHDDLAPLVASPQTDLAAVNHAIFLLQSERAVLIAGGDSSVALSGVLREADRLVARLRAGLARVKAAPVPALIPVEDRSRQTSERRQQPERQSRAESSPRPTASAAPKPSATAAPAPSTSARPTATPSTQPTATPSTQPTASPQPAPSTRPSGDPTAPPGPLPKGPPTL